MNESPMKVKEHAPELDDLQAGKAGEYLVCADLILRGYVAFPSEQGLPFDVVADINHQLVKIQVKTTRAPALLPRPKSEILGYQFGVRKMAKGGRKAYGSHDVDLFALVALDTREIGYLAACDARITMEFRAEKDQPKRWSRQVRCLLDMTFDEAIHKIEVTKALAHQATRGENNVKAVELLLVNEKPGHHDELALFGDHS